MKRRRLSLRVDFSGLGEPIRRLIQGALEVWGEFRRRKSRDQIEKIKAFSFSLTPLREIEALRREGALTDDDAHKLKYCVIESATEHLEPNSQPKNPTDILSIHIWHKPGSQRLLEPRQEKKEILPPSHEPEQQDRTDTD
jgi:hypothetical protein